MKLNPLHRATVRHGPSGRCRTIVASAVTTSTTIPATTVFLSHSSADKEFARRLSGDLQRHGVDVWIDEVGIHPGVAWRAALDAALQDVDFVLALVSPASVRSRWVRYEIETARRRGIRIVPVLYQPTDLAGSLADIQIVDLSTRAAYRRGLQRLVTTFSSSWTIPRHDVRPWTKRRIRMAVRAGLVVEADGRIEFSRRVAERLRVHGARWLRGLPPYGGTRVCADFREYSGLAILHSIDPRAGLTEAQELAIADEAHRHLLPFLLDVAVRGRIMVETGETLTLDPELADEMSAELEHIGELGFTAETDDLHAAATIMFVELVRERLIDRIPDFASLAEPVATSIHGLLGFWTGPEGATPILDEPAAASGR